MIETTVKKEILKRLDNTEKNEGVHILMAIESGSRAWGFPSPNSDYDVRFIYVREKDWYLSVDLEAKRDVIEYPITDEIDLNGWDVKKALKLFWKSNPAFIEWIQSPITYIDTGNFREQARNLLPAIYSIKKGIYHYRSIAKTNYRRYSCDKMVPLKTYFYILRPLLAIKWLEEFGSAAPIEFGRLVSLITDSELLESIHALLEKKKKSEEKILAPAIPVLNNYIEAELSRLENIRPASSGREAEISQLNALFRMVLNEKQS